jgi:pimeloyl-ACP methyl ester carboxylesterase
MHNNYYSDPLPPDHTACKVDVDGRTIRAHRLAGVSPTVVFCGGFRSDMSGTKAMMLDAWCRERGQAYLRYDYSGHGVSDGEFEAGTIGQWLQDTLAVIDDLTHGPLVLVGSSMGGWIMLLAALARRERIAALVGIASAADFTEDLLWGGLSPVQQETLVRDGRIELPSDYSDAPHVITRTLVEEGRHHLLLDETIAVSCPVRLLHSLDDPDVPWETSLRIMQRIGHPDVRLTLMKDAGHRMSRSRDLQQILAVVGGLLNGGD